MEMVPVPPSDCFSPVPVPQDTDPSEKPAKPDRSTSEPFLQEQLKRANKIAFYSFHYCFSIYFNLNKPKGRAQSHLKSPSIHEEHW